jgi:hypothetical protein
VNKVDDKDLSFQSPVHHRAEEKRVRGQNTNSKGRHRYSSRTSNHLTASRHSSSSQNSQPKPNNDIDDSSMSKSTLILAEEDDEYELLDEQLRSVVSWK